MSTRLGDLAASVRHEGESREKTDPLGVQEAVPIFIHQVEAVVEVPDQRWEKGIRGSHLDDVDIAACVPSPAQHRREVLIRAGSASASHTAFGGAELGCTGRVGKNVPLGHFPGWQWSRPEPQAGHPGVYGLIAPLPECIEAHRREGGISAQSGQPWGRQRNQPVTVEVAIRLLQMHAEQAGGQVNGGANLIGGFVWRATQDKHVVLDQARHGVRPLAFLAPVEEMDLQVLGREKRQIDIPKAPLHVEAVIVSEGGLNTADEIVTGA